MRLAGSCAVPGAGLEPASSFEQHVLSARTLPVCLPGRWPKLKGWLGGLLERLPGPQFWALHAALVGTAGVLTLGAARLFGQLLTPTGAPSSDAAGAEGDAQLP